MKSKSFIKYNFSARYGTDLKERSEAFYREMDERRSIRDFSNEPVPREVIENIIKTASTAPSGAHKQPWTFVAVSNPALKRKIRLAAEEEEKLNYSKRMSEQWLKDLEPFDTDWEKPMLEIAPWLIVVFRKAFDYEGDEKKKNYYVTESVGIATGFLLTAIHQAGLASLTHTPSPMAFLCDVLERPKNERAFLLIPVGYPAKDCMVPDLKRKELSAISEFKE